MNEILAAGSPLIQFFFTRPFLLIRGKLEPDFNAYQLGVLEACCRWGYVAEK